MIYYWKLFLQKNEVQCMGFFCFKINFYKIYNTHQNFSNWNNFIHITLIQALKSVSSNLKQGAKDAIGSALISANTHYAAKSIDKYVKAYVVFLQGKSSLPPVWEEGVLLFQHSSMLTKIVNYSTLGGDKVSTRWKLRELDLLSTYLGICKERGYLPNKEDCNMNSFKAAIRTESGKCWDLGAF